MALDPELSSPWIQATGTLSIPNTFQVTGYGLSYEPHQHININPTTVVLHKAAFHSTASLIYFRGAALAITHVPKVLYPCHYPCLLRLFRTADLSSWYT